MSFNRSSMFPSSSSTRRTVSIINKFASVGYTRGTVVDFSSTSDSIVQTLSGALTATTLKTMLNIAGAGGRMAHLSVRTEDATVRTIRVVVTVDGVVVYDYTSASAGTSGTGCCLAGKYRDEASACISVIPDIVWTTSLKIEIASSLTETDKLKCQWLYNTEA